MDLAKLTALATDLRARAERINKPHTSNTKSWYNIKNAGGETVIGIYDEIGDWGVTASDFLNELNKITDKNIRVEISSPGGNVYDALAIYAGLSSHPSTVATDVISHAFSAASYIAQAAAPGKRRIRKNARMMIHDPAIGGGVVYGNARQLRQFKGVLEEVAVQLDEAADNIASIYAEKSGNNDLAHWRNLMENETFFSASAAHTEGLVDEVVEADGSSSEPQNSAGVSAHDTISPTAALDDFGGLMDMLKGAFRA